MRSPLDRNFTKIEIEKCSTLISVQQWQIFFLVVSEKCQRKETRAALKQR